MALWNKLSRNADIRLAQLLKRLGKKTRVPVSYETGAGTSIPSSSQPSGGATAHTELSDMPSASIDDHTNYLLADGTRALAGAWDMASQATTNVNIDSGVITGITDLAIADGGTGESTAQAAIDALSAVGAATNEHVLTKDTGTGNAIYKASGVGASPWERDGTDIVPVTAGDDVILKDGHTLGMSDDAAGTAIFFMSVTGDGNVRLSIEAGGTLNWGDGAAAPDVELSRSAADTLTLAGLLEISSTATSGNTLKIIRDLDRDHSDAPVVLIHNADAADDQYALRVVQDGTVASIGTIHSGAGYALHATTTSGDAVYGLTAGGNTKYGGTFNKTYLGDYADLDEGAAPANPPAGKVRLYAKTDGRMYAKDDAGNVHDLTCQHKQSWDMAQLSYNGSLSGGDGADGLLWDAQDHAGAIGGAPVNSQPATSGDFTNYALLEHYGRWEWTAEFLDPPGVLIQDQLIVGVPFRKFGDGADRDGNCAIIVKVRVRTDDVTFWDSMKLFLNDVDKDGALVNNVLGADFLGSMTNREWYEATLAITDVGAYEINMRAGIAIIGKDWDAADSYAQQVDLEIITVEQWVN